MILQLLFFLKLILKLLITAEESERIRRRAKQLYGDDYADNLDSITDNVSGRDKKDSTVVDFFTPADDVTVVDTLSFSEVVESVSKNIEDILSNFVLSLFYVKV